MKNLIKQLIPKSIKKKLRRHFKSEFQHLHEKKLDAFLEKAPVVELSKKHLSNLIGLPDRTALLEVLPNGGVFAELGVDEGNFSEQILKYNKPKKLHLIDVWENERYNKRKQKHVEEKLATEISNRTVEVNLGYSTYVVKDFPDSYFDCVYIDTVHDYKITSQELALYAKKVKENGYLAGHDYVVGNWRGRVKYGVIEAVHEFCVKENWEFAYLTMETQALRSFALRRIKSTVT